MKGTKAYDQFMEILDLFIPADAEIEISSTVAPEEAMFFMSDLPELAPILGITSTIS